MKKNKIIVNTKTKKYPIFIGYNILKNCSSIFKSNNMKIKKCLIVVDSKVPKKNLLILKKQIKSKDIIIHKFSSNEKNKSFKSVDLILNKLFKSNFNRDDYIIALGGGITGDIVGFAASIYKRGIKFINIPSTLLAQVDSSIGGKTGINNLYGKNLIGSFYHPDLVISDVKILKSLPKREIICGYGEILKHSIISGKKIFNYLNKNKYKILSLETPFIEKIIFDSCKIKKKVVEIDEKEKNFRKILNLGHTFAHSYEASLGYSKKLNHGEAVILGIISSLKFSLKNNYLEKKIYDDVIKHIKDLNLPNNLNKFFGKNKISSILKFMRSDKKNTSKKINLILIKNFGKIILNLNFDQSYIKKFFYSELIN
tara:strand:+ start:7055 stop:8161 length:1107 start_codon:yes stop_codon:yes gene_type:complete